MRSSRFLRQHTAKLQSPWELHAQRRNRWCARPSRRSTKPCKDLPGVSWKNITKFMPERSARKIEQNRSNKQ